MKKIFIITDTDSSLPPQIAKELNIYQVPITIHFENENYTTGLDIDDARVFELIDQYKKLPTTSAPPPSAFAKAYQTAFEQGADAVVCICVSSKVSSTYNSAHTACEMFPEKEIHVIDSLNVSMGQGFMVLAAAEAAASGADSEEVLAVVENQRERLHTYAALPTLKYLAMSGRVGKMVAGMADTLNIKPILTIKDGKLELLERVRTTKKAYNRAVELARLAIDGKSIERAAVIHVNNLQGAETFRDMLRETLPTPEQILIVEFTPGLSIHAGAGLVGAVLLSDE